MTFLERLQLWLGTQASADILLDAQKRFANVDPATIRLKSVELLAGQTSAKNEYADHYMITSFGGGVAGIDIRGALTSSTIPLRAWGFNATTYEEIQAALTTLLKDPSIEKIVALYNTPGGSMNGLNRTSNLMAKAGKVKELYTFTDSQMASAGYWLGANGRKIVADPLAQVGSIGVYVIMHSMAEQLEKEGIDVKVVRAGEFKALGLPVEPLSDAAIAEAQAGVDRIYGAFLEHTSAARGIPKETFRKKAAEGRVFDGADAVKVGLVDKVALFDDFMAELLQSGNKVKPRAAPAATPTRTPRSQDMNIFELLASLGINLTDAQTAALSSGADLKSIGLSTDVIAKVDAALAEAEEKEQAEADAKATADAEASAEAEAKAKAEKEAAEAAAANNTPAAAASPASTDAGILKELTNQMLGLQSDLTKAQAALLAEQQAQLSLKAQLEEANNGLALLKEIAIDRINALGVSMRKSYAGLDKLSVSQLAATFQTAKGEFEKTFPVGQKSKSSTTTPTPGRVVPPAIQQAALKASKI